jgi:hypothetical protein
MPKWNVDVCYQRVWCIQKVVSASGITRAHLLWTNMVGGHVNTGLSGHCAYLETNSQFAQVSYMSQNISVARYDTINKCMLRERTWAGAFIGDAELQRGSEPSFRASR